MNMDDLTEMIFILDRSGSMSGLESDTIGGYNSILKAQKEVKGEAHVTTILFDEKYEVLHNGEDIGNVQPITGKEYFVRGSTALLDAIGKTIIDIGLRFSNTIRSERPSRVLVVITTDGYENASREFSYQKIKEMISYHEVKYSWEFMFIGANMDAVKEAGNLGIKLSRATNYVADSDGTKVMYETLNQSVTSFRNTGALDDNWNENINKNNQKKRN